MSRRTKDGSFLTALVDQGLLAVVADGETPFDATYSLTERGKHAAEYGVFEVDWAEFKAHTERAKEEKSESQPKERIRRTSRKAAGRG